MHQLPPEPAAQELATQDKAAAAGLPPAASYLKAAELDPPPYPLHEIQPEYPDAAGMQEGLVVLRLLINEEGKVDDVAVLRSYPVGLFEDSARAAFSSARFSPGMLLGIPVKSQITIQVLFTPENKGQHTSGHSY